MSVWRRLHRSRGPRSTPVLAALAAARIAVPPLHFVDADPPGTGRGVWAFHAPAEQLLPWWRRLRTAHHVTGLWPVILGPHTELGEVWVTTEDPDDVVAAGLAMDATAILAQRRKDVEPYPAYDSGVDVRPARGDATGLDAQNADDFSLAEEDGWLGLLAAPHGYVVPGLLSWSGAANVNLDGADQVAILKHWHDHFGAELVALGFDILELYVPRPPTDAETALAVAEEHRHPSSESANPSRFVVTGRCRRPSRLNRCAARPVCRHHDRVDAHGSGRIALIDDLRSFVLSAITRSHPPQTPLLRIQPTPQPYRTQGIKEAKITSGAWRCRIRTPP